MTLKWLHNLCVPSMPSILVDDTSLLDNPFYKLFLVFR